MIDYFKILISLITCDGLSSVADTVECYWVNSITVVIMSGLINGRLQFHVRCSFYISLHGTSFI
jgi:hypothetical protein